MNILKLKALFYTTSLLLLSSCLYAQNSLSLDFFNRINSWSATQYFSDFSKGSPGFVFAGSISSPSTAVTGCAPNDSSHALLVLTDENASVKWARCYAVSGTFQHVGFGANNSIWAAGYFDTILGAPRLDTLHALPTVLKCDSSGNPLWFNSYGCSVACELDDFITTSDGGSLLLTQFNNNNPTGDIPYKYGSNPFYYNGWLCKLDSSGKIQWSLVLGGSGNQAPQKVKETERGVYTVLIGTSSTDYMLSGLGVDSIYGSPWILKVDTAGHILSSRIVKDPSHTGYLDFVWPSSVDLVLAGEGRDSLSTYCHPTSNQNDFVVSEVDTTYNLEWCAVNGGNFFGMLMHICSINDSLVVAGGYTQSNDLDLSRCSIYSSTSFHAWFGLYNLNQHRNVWMQSFCGSNEDWIKGLIYDTIENALYVLELSGDTDGDFEGRALPNSGNMYLLKYTPTTDTTAIEEIGPDNFTFHLYPNPANDYSIISSDAYLAGATLQVIDLAGRTLTQTRLESSYYKLETSDYPSGLYFIKIADANGNVGVRKLVEE